MRTHRGKFDWSRPFKLIDSKPLFDSLDADNIDLVININSKQEPPTPTITKKEEIIVPKIETVKRITEPKKFAKEEANYIRISQDLNLPKLMSYELNEVDHVFLQGHSNRFKLNGKTVLTPDFLSHAFIELELKAGKDPVLPRTKGWMMAYIEREHKNLMSMPNIEQFAEVFYNYWKNRREELKFPMLRPLWRPNPEEYNHLLAFKPREKEKRNLRRTNRLAEDEIAQELEEQFSLAARISERIKFRQELKHKQTQLQLTNFHNECKQYFGMPTFFQSFDLESRAKDKQKLKKLQGQVEGVKKQQLEEEKQNEQDVIAQQTFDQKQSVVDFLSTVISVAEGLGVTYDKIYHDKPSNNHKPIIKPFDGEQKMPVEQQTQAQKADYLNLKLYRDGNTIYRTLEEPGEQIYHKPPTDFFDYYKMMLQCYYYGDDDDGSETKDLRRNTSTSFKKYLQNFKGYQGEP